MPKFTFIINTYPFEERPKKLSNCLKSIFDQTYQDFVVLIIENYKDASLVIPILKRSKDYKDRISVITDPKKKLSYLFNLGWKSADTEFLAYVADDVTLEKNWLENINKEFENDENKRIGIVTGPIISAEHPAGEMHRLYLASQKNFFYKALTWPYLHFTMEDKVLMPGYLFESGAYSIGSSLEKSKDYPRQEIDLATTSSMGIRKEVIEKINGFDERFNFNHADGDLFIRIKKAKYKIIFNPKIVSHHHLQLGPSRNAYIIGKDTGTYYKKDVCPKSFKGFLGAFLNILVLNGYWFYNAFRTKDIRQLKGISGFLEGFFG